MIKYNTNKTLKIGIKSYLVARDNNPKKKEEKVTEP